METQKPRILVADDEPEILAVYKTKFERAGFDLLTASDGIEVIAMATAHLPDLILMDVKMPRMDGITAQKKLYETPETRELKVVFLTAFSDPAAQEIDENFGRELGVYGVIKKGGDLNDLVSQIQKYLKA